MNINYSLANAIHSMVVNEALVDSNLLLDDNNYTSLLTDLINKDFENVDIEAIKASLFNFNQGFTIYASNAFKPLLFRVYRLFRFAFMLYLGGGLCFPSDQGASMNEQTLFKKDWIFKMIDKAHDQGLVISPDIISSIYNIPEKDALALINEWFASNCKSIR